MMPVTVVASSPGGFQGEDGPDTPCTHGREPLAKARALVASGPTPAHVLIDHEDVGKPQPAGLIGEGIWPPLTLGVGADLMARGLANIDIGITLEMDRVNLGAHGYTPRSGHCG
jgi:hypothetical protein